MGEMFLLVTRRHFCPLVKKDTSKYQTSDTAQNIFLHVCTLCANLNTHHGSLVA